MNNLKKFSTEADYSAATLNYPAVSWVTATDNVHFDKSAPTPPLPNEIMMAWTAGHSGQDVVLWNGGASLPPSDLFSSLSINDTDLMETVDASATLYNYTTENDTYVVKYELLDSTATTINDLFSGQLGGGFGSEDSTVDFYVPSQFDEIDYLPDNTKNLVVGAETPITEPYALWSTLQLSGVYVPDNAVNAYKSAWTSISSTDIHPISEYQGNLPV